MDWIALISIIVTVLATGISIYSIFSDKKKKKRENFETQKFLKTKDSLPLVNWAYQKNNENDLLELIKRLIFVSDKVEQIDNNNTDLTVNSNQGTEFIPEGLSNWEVCVTIPSKSVLEEQLKILNQKAESINSQEITNVLIIPYLLENKLEWIKNLSNTKWKKVKIYDAQDITKWLDNEPSVEIWFEIKHIGNFPINGVVLPEEFWENWITGFKNKLNSNIILGGRENEKLKLVESIKNPSIITIQSVSREESLAFIMASFITDNYAKDTFFHKCFIIDNPLSFKYLIEKKDHLILIPRFEDFNILNLALHKGHTVIVPIGLDDISNWENKISLPTLDRDSFVKSLVESGYSDEIAIKLSKESARNITILRRQLEFTRTIPQWAKAENIKDIIPLLFVGRWSDDNEKDRALISELAGTSYETYMFKLKEWLYTSDSPILKIGNFWRLASPLDAWSNCSHFLSYTDLEKLNNSFLKVLSEKNPAFEVSAKERLFGNEGENIVFSSWVKEGLTQSLIIISVFGDKLKIDLPFSSQLWVDKIFSLLLSNDDIIVWKSFEHFLPQIAEASPESFLNSLEFQLSKNKSIINDLFKEEDGFTSPSSYHTGLLWGLENIAWIPEYLSRVSVVLTKLAAIDPGGRLSNRPINSLIEIFKPWHYQTLANFKERIEVLQLIAKTEKVIAWKLLCAMLPDNHSIGFPTHKMRWRLFDEILEKSISYQEIWYTHSAVIDLLISLFDNSESKLANIIEISSSNTLLQYDRKKIIEFLDSQINNVIQTDFIAWATLREILSKNRTFPDSDWALPETELEKYQEFYNRLTPKDEIVKNIWLFNDYNINLPQGFKYPDISYEVKEKVIKEKRIEALKSLFLKLGIEKVVKLSFEVKQPWIYGDILAQIIDDEDYITKYICSQLILEKNKLGFVQSFFWRKSILNGIDWIFNIFEKLKNFGFDNSALANLLLSLEQTRVLWEKLNKLDIGIQDNYWINIKPRFFGLSIEDEEYGLNKLLIYRRFYSAIDACSHNSTLIASSILAQILEKAATEEAIEAVNFDGYVINNIFESFDKKEDIDRDTLIKLEWLYLPVLSSFGSKRSPKKLYEELASNPLFFVDILKCVYKAKDEIETEDEKKEIDNNKYLNRAKQAYDLLNGWNKIPGVNGKFEIDVKILNEWIRSARELANKCGRLEVADMHIGKLLAQYPEENENWPPDEICQIIEQINTDSIKNNFSSATFNKRGSSTRGAFEGGDIERGHAKYFEILALNHRNKFPIVASVLSRLAKGYIEDAKQMDKRAEIDKLEY